MVLCILDNSDAECALRVQLSAACPEHVTIYPVPVKRFLHGIWLISQELIKPKTNLPHLIVCHQDDPELLEPCGRTLGAEDLQKFLVMVGVKIPTIVLQTRAMMVSMSPDFQGSSLAEANGFLDAVTRNVEAVFPVFTECPGCKDRDPKQKWAFRCPICRTVYGGRPTTVLELNVT